MPEFARPLEIAVFVSAQGRGSNLQALLDGCSTGQIAGRISLVVGTSAAAPALARARSAGAEVVIISPKRFEGDEAGYGAAILRALNRRQIGLVCLAGYMRKLPEAVVTALPGRIMNVHPALLPLFGGRGMYGHFVHEAAIASGMKVSGATVHFVDEQYDTGPIIVQAAVPIEEQDTPADLAARVLGAEHQSYVRAAALFAKGRLRLDGHRVRILEYGEEHT